MARSEGVITSIRIYGAAEPFKDSVAAAKVKASQMILVNGLHLGLSRKSTLSILGAKYNEKNGSLYWSACIKRAMLPSDPYYERWTKSKDCFEDNKGGYNGAPYYNECSSVAIKFRGDKIIFIDVSSIDSVC
jgi:hypothetical protein